MSPTKTVRLHPAQMAFIKSQATYRGYVGGIASGKSWVGGYDLCRRAKPGRLYMVIAPTYTMLSDSSFRSFEGVARDLGLVEPGDVKRSAPPSIRLQTGAEVIFRSADEPDRLRGPNLSGIWLDEASLMSEEVFKLGIGRLREAGEQGWLTATFTPKGRRHWTYSTFATGRPDTAIVKSKTKDNPFNPSGFTEKLFEFYGQGQFGRQELGGEFVEGNGRFNADWFKRTRYKTGLDYWQLGDKQVFWKHCQTFGTCDPAASSKQTAKTDDPDFTAICVWAITSWNALIWLDCIRFRKEVPDIIPELQRVYDKWGLAFVDIETVASNRAVYQFAARSKMVVKGVETMGIGKLERSTPAMIMSEAGRVWLPESAPWLDIAEDELYSFTGQQEPGIHDDIVDNLSMAAKRVASKDYQSTGRPYTVPRR